MAAKLETKIAAGALVTFVVVGTVCLLSYQSVHEARVTSRMVAHTYQVLTQLHAAVGDLTDAEAGTRGYLLSGESSYLGRQTENFREGRAAMQELTALTREDTVQQGRIASLRQKSTTKSPFSKRRRGSGSPALKKRRVRFSRPDAASR